MSENEQYVTCNEHGIQQATYVCQHIVESLRDGIPRGFWSSEDCPENPRPDSWCNTCDELLNRINEWRDESETFTGIKLLCGICYDRAKNMNEKL